MFIGIGINREGKRQVLAVDMANRESQSISKGFWLRLKERGLSGVEFVVSDAHAGLRKAIFAVLTSPKRLGSTATCIGGVALRLPHRHWAPATGLGLGPRSVRALAPPDCPASATAMLAPLRVQSRRAS